MEIFDHRIAAAEDRGVALAINAVQKGRQPDAPGHRIEFRQSETVVRQQQIRLQLLDEASFTGRLRMVVDA